MTLVLISLVWFLLGAMGGVAMLWLKSRYVLGRDTESAWMLAPGLFAAAAMWSGINLGALSMFAAFSALVQTAFGAFGVLNLLHQARKGLTPRGGSSA